MCDSEFSAFLSFVTLGDRDVDYVGRGDPSVERLVIWGSSIFKIFDRDLTAAPDVARVA
jgi:hypothetical protein